MVTPAEEQYSSEDPSLKRVDAWWTVIFVDWIAVRLVRVVQGWHWVTPTRLTTTAHALGVVSAAAFGLDALVLAAVLFEVRFVLDCADGKLARERGASSTAGGYLDYEGDTLVVALNLIGLGAWLAWFSEASVLWSVALPASFLATLATGRTLPDLRMVSRVSHAMPGRYTTWMAERRLRPLPSRIDAEHFLLFVCPLAVVALDDPLPLEVGAALVAAYFAYSTLRGFWSGFRLAQAADRRTI